MKSFFMTILTIFFFLLNAAAQKPNVITLKGNGNINEERFEQFKSNVKDNKADKIKVYVRSREGKKTVCRIIFKKDDMNVQVRLLRKMNKYNRVFLISVKKKEIPVEQILTLKTCADLCH